MDRKIENYQFCLQKGEAKQKWEFSDPDRRKEKTALLCSQTEKLEKRLCSESLLDHTIIWL